MGVEALIVRQRALKLFAREHILLCSDATESERGKNTCENPLLKYLLFGHDVDHHLNA